MKRVALWTLTTALLFSLTACNAGDGSQMNHASRSDLSGPQTASLYGDYDITGEWPFEKINNDPNTLERLEVPLLMVETEEDHSGSIQFLAPERWRIGPAVDGVVPILFDNGDEEIRVGEITGYVPILLDGGIISPKTARTDNPAFPERSTLFASADYEVGAYQDTDHFVRWISRYREGSQPINRINYLVNVSGTTGVLVHFYADESLSKDDLTYYDVVVNTFALHNPTVDPESKVPGNGVHDSHTSQNPLDEVKDDVTQSIEKAKDSIEGTVHDVVDDVRDAVDGNGQTHSSR